MQFYDVKKPEFPVVMVLDRTLIITTRTQAFSFIPTMGQQWLQAPFLLLNAFAPRRMRTHPVSQYLF